MWYFKMGDSGACFFADGKEPVEKGKPMVQHGKKELNCSNKLLARQVSVGLRVHRYLNRFCSVTCGYFE